ncbi:MAG: flavodoxin [Prevotella sp.]|jgi:flavodoxin
MKQLFTIVLGLFALLTANAQPKTESNMNEKKVLVAYFSATGNTKAAAEKLHAVTGGDLFEIQAAQPYTEEDLDWTNEKSRTSVEMRKTPDFRPAIAKKVDNIDEYDILYIGFPIWWYTAPTIINTFIESYNLEGKTIRFFATSGGSTPDKALKLFKEKYPKLHFKDCKLLNGASEDEIRKWVNQ